MRGCIVNRGKSWSVVVYLGLDPASGKEKRKWFTHKTRREAEAHLTVLLTQLQGAGTIPTTKIRLGDYLERWLRDYGALKNLAPSTRSNYGDTVRVHLVPALGHIPLLRLSPEAIRSYLSEKLREKHLSPTSIQYHYGVLRKALNYAVREGLLARNPCAMVDPPRRQRIEMRVLDEEQVRLFLAEAKRSSPYYCLYLAATLTGMRQGELLGLRWKDLGLGLEVASVQQTFYRLGGQRLFREPKSEKSRRTVALPPILIEELSRLRDQQQEYRRLLADGYQDNSLVFCQRDGKPLHAHNIVQRDFHKVLERAGLFKTLLVIDPKTAEPIIDPKTGEPKTKKQFIRFHDLRHSHATQLLRQGVNPKVVQERLGHSTPAFTLHVYSHVLPGMQEEAVAELQSRLFGGVKEGEKEGTR